ncbi:ROK family transcriptional regulator [Limimaricola cinnabarinus]|jgi:predicted NBD/HSP70 family sugar kinase|uniref:Sugar kinase n=1 Tax=Limimaricola cinnabarinus TaxID=1125964 RepID=A0A2G1MHK6_9RHOB|nr:ROK family transcriptional regulator [Limimaricola cinnabarinus]PHP28235.1 sugar kinase [Limimaricola cinnabarinus]
MSAEKGTDPARLRAARGKNPGRSRAHNRRVVLDLMRGHGQLGRRQLAEMTQLTPQAVTNILDELIAAGLIEARGRLKSGRGQPPLQFAINPDGAITIGIEIAVTRMAATVLDLGGHPRHEEIVPLADSAPEALLPLIAETVARLAAGYDATLMGVGVVMPGPFEIEGFSGVGPTTLPGWAGIDMAAELGRRIGVPVSVENDANAAAIGETLFGSGQALSSFAVVYFGAGLGLGLIADDRPVRGAFGNAGEVGHIVVAPGGRACPCGQSGCLERYASLHALREALDAAGLPGDHAALDRMMAEAEPVLMTWIAEAAAHLSPMVAILENVLDPEAIILGGALPAPILDAIIARIGFAPSVAARSDRAVPRVIRGRAGPMAAALGAAALPFHAAITPRLELSQDPEDPFVTGETA